MKHGCSHVCLNCQECYARDLTVCHKCHLVVPQADVQPISPDDGAWCQNCCKTLQNSGVDSLGRLIEDAARYTQECRVELENAGMRTINLRVNQDFAEDFLVFLIQRKRKK